MEATVLAPSAVVPQVLDGREDYNDWCVRVKTYLLAEDLWDLTEDGPSDAEPEVWRKKNAKALHAIQISCGPQRFSLIRDKITAKDAWDTLDKMFKLQSGEASGHKFHENHQPFFDAVRRGDWSKTKEFLTPDPNVITATNSYGTALHNAAWCGQEHIVEQLVQFTTEQDLEIIDPSGVLEKINHDGVTALSIAARFSMKMVKCMVRKNQNLPSIVTEKDDWPPILYAASHQKWDIVRYLFSLTTIDKDLIRAKLLHFSLASNQHDIAWELLQQYPRLFITDIEEGKTPISTYAERSGSFPSGKRLNLLQQMIYQCIYVQSDLSIKDFRISVQNSENEPSTRKFSCSSRFLRRLAKRLLELLGVNRIYELKLIHVRSLEILEYMCEEIKDLSDKEILDGKVYDAIFTAIESGISEFIIPLCKAKPEMVWRCNSKGKNIFHYSIQCRQEKIYNLVYGVPQSQLLKTAPDHFRNSWLHTAGFLSPLAAKLDRIPGAALQMQRERQWFKEVESTSIPSRLSIKNKDGLTAQQLFTKTHKKLMADGEKWMKETATSCTVVGALIITVMFAAVFTVPGGNNGGTGYPIFLNKKFFKVFIISDAISLFSATTSVLMFLGILTARYREDDFLKSLPTKMIIGLSALFISISTMMVAFCTALFVLLHDQLWAFIPIVLLASGPVSFFMWMQFPLLVDDKKVKHWI